MIALYGLAALVAVSIPAFIFAAASAPTMVGKVIDSIPGRFLLILVGLILLLNLVVNVIGLLHKTPKKFLVGVHVAFTSFCVMLASLAFVSSPVQSLTIEGRGGATIDPGGSAAAVDGHGKFDAKMSQVDPGTAAMAAFFGLGYGVISLYFIVVYLCLDAYSRGLHPLKFTPIPPPPAGPN